MQKRFLICLSILLSIKNILNKNDENNSTLTVLDQSSDKELVNNVTTDTPNNKNIPETNKNSVYQKNSNAENFGNNNINLNNKKDGDRGNSDELVNEPDFKITVIRNYEIDKLARKWFYILTFILVIFIIGFLYKFYKCYFVNIKKETDDDGIIRNMRFDTELQRIATSDEDNILDLSNN